MKALSRVLLFLALGACFASMAQNNNLQFLQVKADLSQNTVTCVLQDQNGFLWIGTRNGLNKYDGINMINYYHDELDETSLSNNYIRCLFETKDGELWIGTDGGGVSIYDEKADSFKSFKANGDRNSLSGNWIYAIFEDHNKNIWIGTQNNGLNLYEPVSGRFINYRKNVDDPFSISSNYVTGIGEDKLNNLWISTWGGGLNYYDVNSRRFIHYKHNKEDSWSINSDIIRKLYVDREGEIYIGSDQGLNRVIYTTDGKFVFEKVKIAGEQTRLIVLSILEDTKGNVWVGTENNGITIIEKDSDKLSHYTYNPKYEYGVQNNSIWSLYEDKDGTIWIGTFNKGIFKLDRNLRKFRRFKHSTYYDNSLSNNSVSSFVEDDNGNVWVGTDGGGLDYWNRKTNTFKHYNKTTGSNVQNEVLTIMKDRNDNLWVGTWYGGLKIKKKGSKRFQSINLDHPIVTDTDKANVFSILEDHKGRIWIALFREGLLCYDPNTKEYQGYAYDQWDENSISSNYVRCMLEDKNNTIWVGTEGGGLNKFIEDGERKYFQRYVHHPDYENSISSNSVLSLLSDEDNSLWVGTSAGLNHFDLAQNSWQNYTKRNGLPDDVIYAVQKDDESNLWLSSNKGLSKFNVENEVIRNYNMSDGLQAMEFFKNSSLKLKSGELLFGGIEGFNIFNPKEIKDSSEEPKVYLSGFSISNESVTAGPDSPLKDALFNAKEIVLNHDQNDFSFKFSQLNFNQSNRNEYAYQLVNYDNDWQEIGNRREAYYTNVPPGNYTFRVKGTSNDGRWSSNEASISIRIATPWYKTGIAFFIYASALIAIVFIAFRTMVNRERLQNQLRIDQLEISKMQELDEMKSSFFANISHEFRSPLTLILGPLKVLKEKGLNSIKSSHVDVMIRNAESLLNLINQLLELSKLESGKMRLDVVQDNLANFLKPIVHSFTPLANQKFINYKVSWPKEDIELYFDKEKVEKIIVNLISNALKYTSDFGSIIVELKDMNSYVALSVSDTGVGIPEEELTFVFNRYYRVRNKSGKKNKGTGIGLSLTKELVEVHSGKIEVESQLGKGSTFTVYLKKGKDHFKESDIITSEKVEYLFDKQERYDVTDDIKKQTVADALDSFEDQMDDLPMVLVVEDNPEIREYIRSILEGEYKLIETDNGVDGLELAIEQIPDIIISDVMMPGITGFELCEKIKSDIKTSHIPVVLLTAKASNESAVEGFEVGADYYITKPFNPRLLSLRIRNALKNKEQIKEQLLNKKTLKIEPSKIKIASQDEKFISRAVAIVEENMSNSEFYVDDLGKELGLSRMQLYRKLKALIDQSANEFVRSIRLKRAAQLIAQDQLTISEITYQVGFNDLQYFRDCFKKQFGVNPSEYANQSKNSVV